MTMKQLLAEYDLTIDDIRYYLSYQMAESFLTYKDNVQDLAGYIWSGKLSDDLHNLEEKFIADCEDSLQRRLTDEGSIREQLLEASMKKSKRSRLYPAKIKKPGNKLS